MPITADWLFQNHTAQQVTIQLLVRALSSTEDAGPNLNDAAEIEGLALARPPLDGMPHTPTQGSPTERVVLQRVEQEKQEAMRQKLQKYLWYQQLYDALLKTFTLKEQWFVEYHYNQRYTLIALTQLDDSPFKDYDRTTVWKYKKRLLSKADAILQAMVKSITGRRWIIDCFLE